MAKTGLFGGLGRGGGMPTTSGTFAPTASPRPIARGESQPGGLLSGLLGRGGGGILPERGTRAQYDMVQALLQSGMQSAQGSGSPLLAFLAPVAGGAIGTRAEGLYKDAQQGRDQAAIDKLMSAMGGGSVPAPTVSSRGGTSTGRAPAFDSMAATGGPTNAAVIREGLLRRGMPAHVADAFIMNFSDESGLNTGINEANPIVEGSRGGFGLAQWTGPRRRALEAFAEQRGKPVADLDTQLDFLMMEMQGPESNAAQHILSAQDTPQAAAAIVNKFLRPAEEHRARRESQYLGGTPARNTAARVASGDFSTLAGVGAQPGMSQDNMRTLIGLMTNQDVSPEIRNLASTMLGQGMESGSSPMSPQDQIGLAQSMLGLEQALMPPQPEQAEPGFRAATPEEAAQYGAQAGQFGPDGRFYPSTTPNSTSGDAGILRQRNEATTIIGDAVSDLQTQGFSREEALGMIARDPIYGPQFQILGVDPSDLARTQVLDGAADAGQAAQGGGFWQRLFGGGSTPAPSAAPAQPVAPLSAPETDPLGIR